MTRIRLLVALCLCLCLSLSLFAAAPAPALADRPPDGLITPAKVMPLPTPQSPALTCVPRPAVLYLPGPELPGPSPCPGGSCPRFSAAPRPTYRGFFHVPRLVRLKRVEKYRY
jgi:hypothetical protein